MPRIFRQDFGATFDEMPTYFAEHSDHQQEDRTVGRDYRIVYEPFNHADHKLCQLLAWHTRALCPAGRRSCQAAGQEYAK
jgi:hypothetical protein